MIACNPAPDAVLDSRRQSWVTFVAVALVRSFTARIQERNSTTGEQRPSWSSTIPDTQLTPVPAPMLNGATLARPRHVVEASKTPLEDGGVGQGDRRAQCAALLRGRRHGPWGQPVSATVVN